MHPVFRAHKAGTLTRNALRSFYRYVLSSQILVRYTNASFGKGVPLNKLGLGVGISVHLKRTYTHNKISISCHPGCVDFQHDLYEGKRRDSGMLRD